MLAHGGGDGTLRFRAITGDHDTFAGRQAIGLQDDREAEFTRTEARNRIVVTVAGAEPRRRDAVAVHEGLCEGLARLEARRGDRRTDQQSSLCHESIGNTHAQRELRADHRQVDSLAGGQRGDVVRPGDVDGDCPRPGGDPRIAGGADDVADRDLGREPGHERVLPGSAPYDENPHCGNNLPGQVGATLKGAKTGLFR